MRKLQTVLVIMLALACTHGYAEGPPGNQTETVSKAREEDRLPIYVQEKWQFFVSPYLWIPGVHTTISSFRDPQSTNIAWWDTLSHLFSNTIGVMGRAEAWKGRWGFYVDGFHLSYS